MRRGVVPWSQIYETTGTGPAAVFSTAGRLVQRAVERVTHSFGCPLVNIVVDAAVSVAIEASALSATALKPRGMNGNCFRIPKRSDTSRFPVDDIDEILREKIQLQAQWPGAGSSVQRNGFREEFPFPRNFFIRQFGVNRRRRRRGNRQRILTGVVY